jgi:hypothetical protein
MVAPTPWPAAPNRAAERQVAPGPPRGRIVVQASHRPGHVGVLYGDVTYSPALHIGLGLAHAQEDELVWDYTTGNPRLRRRQPWRLAHTFVQRQTTSGVLRLGHFEPTFGAGMWSGGPVGRRLASLGPGPRQVLHGLRAGRWANTLPYASRQGFAKAPWGLAYERALPDHTGHIGAFLLQRRTALRRQHFAYRGDVRHPVRLCSGHGDCAQNYYCGARGVCLSNALAMPRAGKPAAAFAHALLVRAAGIYAEGGRDARATWGMGALVLQRHVAVAGRGRAVLTSAGMVAPPAPADLYANAWWTWGGAQTSAALKRASTRPAGDPPRRAGSVWAAAQATGSFAAMAHVAGHITAAIDYGAHLQLQSAHFMAPLGPPVGFTGAAPANKVAYDLSWRLQAQPVASVTVGHRGRLIGRPSTGSKAILALEVSHKTSSRSQVHWGLQQTLKLRPEMNDRRRHQNGLHAAAWGELAYVPRPWARLGWRLRVNAGGLQALRPNPMLTMHLRQAGYGLRLRAQWLSRDGDYSMPKFNGGNFGMAVWLQHRTLRVRIVGVFHGRGADCNARQVSRGQGHVECSFDF